jgi:hypothetical protein
MINTSAYLLTNTAPKMVDSPALRTEATAATLQKRAAARTLQLEIFCPIIVKMKGAILMS